jgi:hypothetical protein
VTGLSRPRRTAVAMASAPPKTKAELKAERRAKQEAQRAAKAERQGGGGGGGGGQKGGGQKPKGEQNAHKKGGGSSGGGGGRQGRDQGAAGARGHAHALFSHLPATGALPPEPERLWVGAGRGGGMPACLGIAAAPCI